MFGLEDELQAELDESKTELKKAMKRIEALEAVLSLAEFVMHRNSMFPGDLKLYKELKKDKLGDD